MTYEFLNIVEKALEFQSKELKTVLVTIVKLEGTSYRRPGARMLIAENGEMVGAVSGGCVEKEIFERAAFVFETGQSLMMTYDGRKNLGCAGIIYLLIEPFFVEPVLQQKLDLAIKERASFGLKSSYIPKDGATGNFKTEVQFQDGSIAYFSANSANEPEAIKFKQVINPRFKLLIIGGHHDAVQLCKMAHSIGWEVHVLTCVKNPKELSEFPGAASVNSPMPNEADLSHLDENTAAILMSHNFPLDLIYLQLLQDKELPYVGMLGSRKRKEKLVEELQNETNSLTYSFIESLYAPAGLNIGAETPEEIALSILSEIMAVTRSKKPHSLRALSGGIHA